MSAMRKNVLFRTNRAIRVLMFGLGLFSTISFSVPSAHAGYWGEAIAASILKRTLDTIYSQIQGMILGTLKSAAMQVLNSQVGRLIGGTSAGKALFITNYQTFLYKDPLQKTNLYMNDFFTLTTRGKSSSSNYIGVGDIGNRMAGSYASYLVGQAKQATIGAANQQIRMTLDQYTPSPQRMFAEGDWRAFNAFFSNPANNSFGYTLMAQQAYQSRLASEQNIQQVKATASGFLPSEKNGQVLSPAATIEALAGKVQNIGSDLIAAASNPGELISSAVTAMATKMINGLVQKGIGQIQANIQKEIGNVTREIDGAINDATRQLGPGAQFLTSVNQRTDVFINPNTPAPPAATDTAAILCSSYGQTGICTDNPSADCRYGSTKGGCPGTKVCCYNPPSGTSMATGQSCTSYGQLGACSNKGDCKNGYTTSSCTGGLVCCYNPPN